MFKDLQSVISEKLPTLTKIFDLSKNISQMSSSCIQTIRDLEYIYTQRLLCSKFRQKSLKNGIKVLLTESVLKILITYYNL